MSWKFWKKTRKPCICLRCHYAWISITSKPKICPRCKSAGWATFKTDRRGLRDGETGKERQRNKATMANSDFQ